MCVALDGLKTGLAYLGDTERLATVVAALEPLARRRGDLFLLQWAVFESAFVPFAHAEWSRATALIEDSLELNRRSGRATHQGWFRAHLGWIARVQGRHADATAHGRTSLLHGGDQPHSWWNAFSRAMLATTLVELGERDEAISLLQEGLRFADRGGTPAYRLRCLALLAQLTASASLLSEADSILASVSTPAGRAWLHGIDVYVAVASAHLDAGAVDAAEHVIAPVVAAARSTGHIPALAQATLLDARCASARGDPRRVRTAAGEVETLAERYGMTYLAAQARGLRAG
jgi:hypothetical protein